MWNKNNPPYFMTGYFYILLITIIYQIVYVRTLQPYQKHLE